MKTCRFCIGEVPDKAVKCQHCGEWLETPAGSNAAVPKGMFPFPGSGDESMGRAANRFVSFQIVMTVVGIVVALIFFFAFFLPNWNAHGKRMEDFGKTFPSFPQVPGPR